MSKESSTNEIASSNGQNGNDENLDGFSQLQDLTSKRLLIDPRNMLIISETRHLASNFLRTHVSSSLSHLKSCSPQGSQNNNL